MEITVKVFRTKFTFTSKKDGTQKESEVLALEFGNGKQIRLFEDKWNYRTIDYLNELLEAKN